MNGNEINLLRFIGLEIPPEMTAKKTSITTTGVIDTIIIIAKSGKAVKVGLNIGCEFYKVIEECWFPIQTLNYLMRMNNNVNES